MTLAHRMERWLKPRFAVIYPFGFFFLFFCRLNEISLKAGIGFIIAGALLRLWSNGYAVKNDQLTTCGPYAFVRNPLYVGTFLIAVGFVIVLTSDPPVLERIAGALLLLALGFAYYRTIQGEQGMLSARFKDAYSDYCKQVPAMVPSLIPYGKGEKWPFSLPRLIHSKEHKPFFWVIILLVVFYLKTHLLIEHKSLNAASWLLILMAVFLILLDIAFEFNKKKFQ
ncbi:MAG: hypothetical protein KGJ95_05440 [Candidatus Omnitrophica bacterium]|nr:hypothetical protein [Candidatus Omnitrophota bacterium]MDE2231490.1 hypothetical protein [Candidatus Omnitrophota bacterium]